MADLSQAVSHGLSALLKVTAKDATLVVVMP
jgi:hypothetical protein